MSKKTMNQIIPQRKGNSKLPFLNERIQEFFTDREDLRQIFDRLLTGSEPARRVLNIHGPDMRGKTALLQMLAVSCRNKDKYVALANARDAKTPEDILSEFADHLEAEGISLPSYQKVLKISSEPASTPHPGEQKTGMPDLIGSGVDKVIESPTPENATGQSAKILVIGILNVVQNLLSRNRKRIKQDLDSKGHFPVLSEYFVQDLKELGDQSPQPIVLMLDHFEYVTDPKGELLNWVNGLVSDPAFLIVIAGRTPIGYIPRQAEELPPLDDDKIGELVRNYCKAQAIDCPDETKVRNIVKFAVQVPSLAVWAIETCRDLDERVPDWDIEKFLKLTPGDDALLIGQRVEKLLHQWMENKPTGFSRVLEAAAIVRGFDYDILKHLVGEVTDNFYQDVKGLPIVFRGENLSIPEPVREVINEKLRSENPERYFQLHQKASEFYERRLQEFEIDPQRRKKQTLVLETLYHKYQFPTDDVRAAQCAEKYFREAFIDAFNRRQFDFCESLLMQVTLFDISVTGKAWVRFYRSLMNWYRQIDVEEARRTLKELAHDPTLDDDLLSYLHEVLGWISWYDNDIEQAKDHFKKSLDIRQDNPNDVLGRIRVQVWQGVIYQRTEGAGEEYLKPALDLAEKLLAEVKVTGAGDPHEKEKAQLRPILAWAHLEFGNSLMLQGRHEEAQQHIKTSIAAYKRLAMRFQHGRALMTYGRLLIYQGKLKEAQDSLLQSIRLFRDFKEPWTEAWAESWLGDVAFQRGDLKAAEKHYISAKTKWAKDEFGASVADGGLAEVALARGELDRALEIAEATLQVKKTFEDPFGIAWTENTIGNVLLAKKDAAGAEQAFEEGYQAAKTSRSFLAESLLGLGKCRIMDFRNDETGFAEAAKAVEHLACKYSFFDFLAHLRFMRATLRLRKLAEKGSALSDSDIEGVTQMLLESLTTALRHNVFVLYTLLDQAVEILHSYDARLTEQGDSVRAMMVHSLRDRWKQTKFDNKTLETLEKRNRATESIDQLQCETVVNRLNLVA